MELLVAPRGVIHYSLDGSEPRNGSLYSGPLALGAGETILCAFAEADGVEAKAEFRFPAQGKAGVQISETKPAFLVAARAAHKLDSRAKSFEGLKQAAEKGIEFENVSVSVGQGSRMASITIGEVAVNAAFLETLLTTLLEKFEPTTPVTLAFRKAHFSSGHDLQDFADKLGITLQPGDIEQ